MKTSEFIHVVEFSGGGGATEHFSRSPAVISWSVIEANPITASHLKAKYDGSKRVSVKSIFGDFTGQGSVDRETEEGTFHEFERYINEVLFFGEKGRGHPYWVLNSGRARVDVAIAALPLLSRTGGLMFLADFDRTCYDTLLQFYDVVEKAHGLAMLKPKSSEELEPFLGNKAYDWCFSFKGRTKTVRVKNGPSDTSGAMNAFSSHVSGCNDLGQMFYCDQDPSTGAQTNCLPCADVLLAITKRGFWLNSSIEKILKGTAEL